MMSSSTSPTDHHNGSLAKRHSGNGGVFAGILSSWMGYFTGRQYDTNNAQEMFARNEQMMARMEQLMNKLEEKLERLEKLESLGDRGNVRVERKGHPDEEMILGEGQSDDGENVGSSFDEEYSDDDDEENYSDDAGDESISSEDLKGMGESLQAYQEMVATNWANWTYSANCNIHLPDLDDYEIHNTLRVLRSLKESTIKMRRGEYHSARGRDIGLLANNHDFQGVNLEPCENELDEAIQYHSTLKPHWKEFVDALDDFELILDIMPCEAEPCFQISQIELPVNIFKIIMKSLEGKSFEHYKFVNNDFGRHGILGVIDLLDSNEHLQSLTLSKNLIDEEDEGDFCEAIVSHPALGSIDLNECCEGRTFILCELVQSSLLHISMSNNDLRFVSLEERQAFTDALVSNTRLVALYLTEIHLNDEDLACFKTVLERNSTLTCLVLKGNHHFTELAKANFGNALKTNNTLTALAVSGIKCHNVLFDDSNLNSAADSNHTCYVDCRHFFDVYNEKDDPTGNRQKKIYNILARRHKEMCNVKYFDDIDINLLPEILAAVQRYAIDPPFGAEIFKVNRMVKSLSIMFEIMRKWDKALSLYKTLGDNV